MSVRIAKGGIKSGLKVFPMELEPRGSSEKESGWVKEMVNSVMEGEEEKERARR